MKTDPTEYARERYHKRERARLVAQYEARQNRIINKFRSVIALICIIALAIFVVKKGH